MTAPRATRSSSRSSWARSSRVARSASVDGRFELSSSSEVPIPETIRDAVLMRIAGISAPARAAAEAAAVAGERFQLDPVARLTGGDGLSELVDRGLIAETDPGWASFRHALAREAIYEDVPWLRRQSLHRGLAEMLERCRRRAGRGRGPLARGARGCAGARGAPARGRRVPRRPRIPRRRRGRPRGARALAAGGGSGRAPRCHRGLRRVRPARRRADRGRARLARGGRDPAQRGLRPRARRARAAPRRRLQPARRSRPRARRPPHRRRGLRGRGAPGRGGCEQDRRGQLSAELGRPQRGGRARRDSAPARPRSRRPARPPGARARLRGRGAREARRVRGRAREPSAPGSRSRSSTT